MHIQHLAVMIDGWQGVGITVGNPGVTGVLP
jgi:hypothetical protein